MAFSKGTAGVSSGASSAAVRTEMSGRRKGDAVKEAAESGVQITAANAWVEKLVAGTVLAQKLFAKELVLTDGGIIRSQDYEPNKTGFFISSSGVFIGGDAVFAGFIDSGPLLLDNEDPSNIESQKIFSYTADLLSYYDSYIKNEYTLCSGLYGSTGFSYIRKRFTGPYTLWLFFLDKKRNEIASFFAATTNSSDMKDYHTYMPLPVVVTFNVYFPGGKTFKLKNLPTNQPNIQGAVWQDTEGYLRIRQ